MPARCCRPSRFSSTLAAAATLALITAARSPAATRSPAPGMSLHARTRVLTEPTSPPVAPGLRTDRLSPKQRERWRAIAAVVFADDKLGRPLHPTLRRMWDEVAASGHEVYLELPEPTLAVCATAGLFRIESVGPDGHVVATLRLNLKTIDRGRLGDATHPEFRRFDRLGREGRYAEVLGHELGHAVFILADAARARHLLAQQSRLLELSRSLRKAKREHRPQIRARMREVDEQIETLETPALAAEAVVWEELVASGAPGRMPGASSTPW